MVLSTGGVAGRNGRLADRPSGQWLPAGTGRWLLRVAGTTSALGPAIMGSMRRALWLTIGWGFTFGISVGLLLRWSEVGNTPGLALVGLAPLLIVPLIGLAVSAWVTATASLRLATLALGVVYFATFPTVGSLVGCQADTAEDEIVIFDHNVRYLHGDPEEEAKVIEAADADVVVLQEAWQEFIDGLAAQPAMARYRYRATELSGRSGLAIWSRWPIEEAVKSDLESDALLSAEVVGPHGSFTVVDVHTRAPVNEAFIGEWTVQLRQLAAIDRSSPVVLAGDFNATADHAQFRGVIGRGWTDVHSPKGCGFDATWPNGRGLAGFPVLRLDHVLVSEHFQVLAVDVVPTASSDHSAVRAVIRLTEPAPDTRAEAEAPTEAGN